jgi:hypothetical protein
MSIWLVVAFCVNVVTSLGLGISTKAEADSKTVCGPGDEHCRSIDDAFVALQVHKVVMSGFTRTNSSKEHHMSPSELVPSAGRLIPPVSDPLQSWAGVKLVDAGLSRTGTESLEVALMKLGYKCSHGERFKEPDTEEFQAMWQAKHLGKEESILPYLEETRADAVMDAPLNSFVPLFRKQYDSKVVLTLHPNGASGWVKSLVKFVRWWQIGSTYKVPDHWDVLPGCKIPVSPDTKLSDDMTRACQKAYKDHNQRIINSVPKERLLIYNVTQGYEPLCNFLGKDQPMQDGTPEAFPWVDNVKMKKDALKESGLPGVGYVNGHTPTEEDEKLIPVDDD